MRAKDKKQQPETVRPAKPSDRREPSSAPRPTGAEHLSFGAVSALQRSAGNAAVSQVIGERRPVVQRATVTPSGGGPEVTLSEGDRKSSREAILYISGNHVYKMYANERTAAGVLAEMEKASAQGVPVPPWTSYAATYDPQDGKSRPKRVTVIRSRRVSGTFFQLSKPGGERAFRNALHGMADVGRMRRIKHQLEAAHRAGIADPQGMISNDPQEGVVFFLDIHTGGTGDVILPLIEAVDSRIQDFAR
ncbi:hypothetical protein [Streptomyces catenulae]|uniref:Protein kinase domain-containing protein n=1 Tax=Streptomyces catenulae TaxID=66875 RepID=A0ABV2Z6X1_9ACTN|nr:hypothetical protein [Streptomyces catenulae]